MTNRSKATRPTGTTTQTVGYRVDGGEVTQTEVQIPRGDGRFGVVPDAVAAQTGIATERITIAYCGPTHVR